MLRCSHSVLTNFIFSNTTGSLGILSQLFSFCAERTTGFVERAETSGGVTLLFFYLLSFYLKQKYKACFSFLFCVCVWGLTLSIWMSITLSMYFFLSYLSLIKTSADWSVSGRWKHSGKKAS